MLSLVVPAFNEEEAVGSTVAAARNALGGAGIEHEVIVVDDGSTDRTAEIASAQGATVLRHPTNLGYGRSLKDGIAAAQHALVAIVDGDGSYPVEDLPKLVDRVQSGGYDMAVGLRSGPGLGGVSLRGTARVVFRILCEWAVGMRIPDINSGMRVFRREMALRFWDTLGPGYSFTTTLTLLALHNQYVVCFVPIEYRRRVGTSKVRLFRDSLRAAQILVEAIATHNPIKIFLPLAGAVGAVGLAALLASLWFPARWAALFSIVALAGLLAAPIVLALGFATVAIQRPPARSRKD